MTPITSSPAGDAPSYGAAQAQQREQIAGGRGRESSIYGGGDNEEGAHVLASVPTPEPPAFLGSDEEEVGREETDVDTEEEESSDEEWDSDEELDSDEEEEEDEEDLIERLRALADARALGGVAAHFLHPERPVETDPTARGRNYFARASAPEAEDREEAEERRRILAEAAALEGGAVSHFHPEARVENADPTAFGRNYFVRSSAPEAEEVEEAVERQLILKEAAVLKRGAVSYAHPEVRVENADPTAFGRNYFVRSSAPEAEEAAERQLILKEAAALKRGAVSYAHPEARVENADPTALGRNYFARVSAPEVEDREEAEERRRILKEAAALKGGAVSYAHPEARMENADPTAFGRSYFARASAPKAEDREEVEEHRRILKEAAALKRGAVSYAHPEKPVQDTDPAAFGRNYYGRPSAPEVEEAEEAVECQLILKEVVSLKGGAVSYAHPEARVENADPTAFGRNYFVRSSAPEAEDPEEAETAVRDDILADMRKLKRAAYDYLHPEKPVQDTDPAAFGRNYYGRPSAPEQEDEDAEEHSSILAEAFSLKKLAFYFAHPEAPLEYDSAIFGRNYFGRVSAPEQEGEEEAEESVTIISEAMSLRKRSGGYAHPEQPVEVEPSLYGRNYFFRASAVEQDEEEDSEERAAVFFEAASLKKFAEDCAHPERPVETTDSTLFGRNFFDRPSAHKEEDRDETVEPATIKQFASSPHQEDADVDVFAYHASLQMLPKGGKPDGGASIETGPWPTSQAERRGSLNRAA